MKVKLLVLLVAILPQLGLAQPSGWQTDNKQGICGMSSDTGPLTFANSGHGLFMIVRDWREGDTSSAEVYFSPVYGEGETVNAQQVGGVSGNIAAYFFDDDSLKTVLAALLGGQAIVVNLGDRTISEPLDGSSSALMAMGNCVSDLPH